MRVCCSNCFSEHSMNGAGKKVMRSFPSRSKRKNESHGRESLHQASFSARQIESEAVAEWELCCRVPSLVCSTRSFQGAKTSGAFFARRPRRVPCRQRWSLLRLYLSCQKGFVIVPVRVEGISLCPSSRFETHHTALCYRRTPKLSRPRPSVQSILCQANPVKLASGSASPVICEVCYLVDPPACRTAPVWRCPCHRQPAIRCTSP